MLNRLVILSEFAVRTGAGQRSRCTALGWFVWQNMAVHMHASQQAFRAAEVSPQLMKDQSFLFAQSQCARGPQYLSFEQE